MLRPEKNSFGFTLNTFGGLHFTRNLLLSVGTGIIRNVDKGFWAVPIVIDFRWFLKPIDSDSFFIFFNTGKYVGLDTDLSRGRALKLGLGNLLKYDKVSYSMELFLLYRTFYNKEDTAVYFSSNAVGIALGIRF